MDKVLIRATIGNKSLMLTFDEDVNIEEWGNMFKSILTFATFHPDTIKELFYEEEISNNTDEETT